jgi:hypothetical protein
METPSAQLLAIARQILAWQTESGLSDAAICRKIPQIGSSKTYKKILNEDFAQIDVTKQLANYQAATAYLAILQTKLPPEPEYDTFSNIQNSCFAVAGAMIEPSIARLVVIEGENGTGKDAVKNALLKLYPEVAVYVEAHELWHDRNDPASARSAAVTEILQAVNPIRRATRSESDGAARRTEIPRGAAAKLRLVIEELNHTKTLLIINEAHHMGPSMLNITKTIINQTPTVIAIECIPKLLSKLVNTNYEEASQLFGNRLFEHVRLQSPPAEEIIELFDQRGIKFDSPDTSANAAQILAGEAAQFGNWRYVTQVYRECWKTHAEKITSKQFDQARAIAIRRRIQNKPK